MTDVIITQSSPQVVIVTEEITNVIESKSQGPQGLSAYQVAVANGFLGTEQQWLDSLTGNQEEYVLTKSSSEIANITINFSNRLFNSTISQVVSVLPSSPDLTITDISHSTNTVSFKILGGVTFQGYQIDISVLTTNSGSQSTTIYLLCI